MSNRSLPLRVAVLLGGPSAERVISLDSGRCVAEGLRGRGHTVTAIDPCEGLESAASELNRIAFAGRKLLMVDWGHYDVVFNALHGVFGEDGQVQSLLESLGVPYTGSGPAAHRDGFHKSRAKELFRRYGIPTPRSLLVPLDGPIERLHAAASAIGWPVVLKPEAQGSSLGVGIARNREQLAHAVARCRPYGNVALLEAYIAGGEWTVPVWDDLPLPIIEILPGPEIFDYDAKYSDQRTEYRFEFDVPEEIVRSIAFAGRAAARALGTQGLARVDVRLDAAGAPWVLEVNTSPGMTDHSLVPKAAEKMGLTLGALCEAECERALARHRMRLSAIA